MSVEVVHIIGLNEVGRNCARYYANELRCKKVILFDDRTHRGGRNASSVRRDIMMSQELSRSCQVIVQPQCQLLADVDLVVHNLLFTHSTAEVNKACAQCGAHYILALELGYVGYMFSSIGSTLSVDDVEIGGKDSTVYLQQWSPTTQKLLPVLSAYIKSTDNFTLRNCTEECVPVVADAMCSCIVQESFMKQSPQFVLDYSIFKSAGDMYKKSERKFPKKMCHRLASTNLALVGSETTVAQHFLHSLHSLRGRSTKKGGVTLAPTRFTQPTSTIVEGSNDGVNEITEAETVRGIIEATDAGEKQKENECEKEIEMVETPAGEIPPLVTEAQTSSVTEAAGVVVPPSIQINENMEISGVEQVKSSAAGNGKDTDVVTVVRPQHRMLESFEEFQSRGFWMSHDVFVCYASDPGTVEYTTKQCYLHKKPLILFTKSSFQMVIPHNTCRQVDESLVKANDERPTLDWSKVVSSLSFLECLKHIFHSVYDTEFHQPYMNLLNGISVQSTGQRHIWESTYTEWEFVHLRGSKRRRVHTTMQLKDELERRYKFCKIRQIHYKNVLLYNCAKFMQKDIAFADLYVMYDIPPHDIIQLCVEEQEPCKLPPNVLYSQYE